MKSEAPTALEKSWREMVRQSGSVLTGLHPCQIHHVAGRTARHRKIKMGHMLILPLTYDEHHLVDEGRSGLHEIKNRWYSYNEDRDYETIEEMSLHEFEKYLFERVCDGLWFPFGDAAYAACLDWHR